LQFIIGYHTIMIANNFFKGMPRMTNKTKNVTFSLPIDLMEKYKNYAKSNYIVSVNAAVKEALEEYSLKIEKDQLKKEMMMAAQDSLFIQDLEECMQAFEPSDRETAGRQKEW
jgi:DNA replicative helicase MCM subunit Mcm2 (Cdc46/Mcm family)